MEKGPKAWTIAMEGEHGIIEAQEKLFAYLEQVPLSMMQGIKNEQLSAIEPLPAPIEQSSFPIGSIDPYVTTHYYHLPFPPSLPSLFIATTNVEKEPEWSMLKSLLATAGTLVDIGKYASAGLDITNRDFISEEQKEAFGVLDLGYPSKVVLDNVDTLLNVFRVAVHNIDNLDEQISQMRALLIPDENDNQGLSQLEQCARAPFGLWALTRKIVPATCNGQPVAISGHGFGSEFLTALKTERVLTPIKPNTRHGGCPALYPAFRGNNHINRFGELFIDWHEKTSKVN